MIFLLTKPSGKFKNRQIKRKKNNMVHSVLFKNTENNDEVALTFRRDNWKDTARTLCMKQHLIPGDPDSEKVGCKYYILSRMGSQ